MMSAQIPPNQEAQAERTRFLVKNLIRGLFGLSVIIGLYIVAKKYWGFDLTTLLGPLYDKPVWIYTIFLLSEVIFGIIPPEFFMLWSMRHGSVSIYVQNVMALAAISYAAGVIGYYIGVIFHGTRLYRFLRMNYLKKFEQQFQQYGGFLLIVAALTPLPFSAICMLVGASNYPFRRFLWIASTRFIRFTVYAIVIWQTHNI